MSRRAARTAALAAMLLASASAALAQSKPQVAPLTVTELTGQWVLTFRPNPPGSKGVQITMTDDAGRSLHSLVVDLNIEANAGKLTRCRAVERLPGASVKSVTCRLDRGGLMMQVPLGGSGGGGSVSFRLARTGSGAIAGLASARAPIVPLGVKVGTVVMVRAA